MDSCVDESRPPMWAVFVFALLFGLVGYIVGVDRTKVKACEANLCPDKTHARLIDTKCVCLTTPP